MFLSLSPAAGTARAASLAAHSSAPGKLVAVETPPILPHAACSFQHAACVHGTDTRAILDALASLDRAYEMGVALGVPRPAFYDVYLANEPSRSAIAERDAISRVDATLPFSIVDDRLEGCSRELEITRELYAASALSRTPAIDEGSLRAETTALAQLAVPCASIDDAVFQNHPERALVDRFVAPRYEEGASLFFSWIDRLGKDPGALITATWALAPTHSPLADEHWSGDPDGFDVLRESTKDSLGAATTIDDVFETFAIDRALAFDAPVKIDWDLPWPQAARSLALPSGIAESGASYVRIDTSGKKTGARFRLDATWEQHAKMRWTVIKLDAHGAEKSRLAAKAAPKATEAHLEIVDCDDASALLVVAVNVGNWTTPFDPNDAIWEPHGWVLTISSAP